MPKLDFAPQLKEYIRTPANAITYRVHIYRKNDISYFPRNEKGEIEVNSHFNNESYELTMSREDKPTTKITLETKFSNDKKTQIDCKTILEQNRKELVKFLANA